MRKTFLAATAALALSLAACGNGPDFADAGSSAAASVALCYLSPQGDTAVAVSCDGVPMGTVADTLGAGGDCLLAADAAGVTGVYCGGVYAGAYTEEARVGVTCEMEETDSRIIITCGSRAFYELKLKTFQDSRDGRDYIYVTIGKQSWMTENLAYEAVASACQAPYGCYYTWDQAMTACPSGWHLPSDAEWDELVNFVGGMSVAGKKLKSKSGWTSNGNGTDEYGFSALPGGYWDGSYFNIAGYNGYWWSSSEISAGYAYYRLMFCINEYANWSYNSQSYGRSVRCVED
jgi:uncharacterized protein (TIGR02145 family)